LEITIGEELIEIQPQVFISIFCSFITAIIPLLAVRYLSLRERNNYIKLLDKHFPLINEFLREIRSYKMLTSLFAFAGLYLGALVSFVILMGSVDFFDFIINTSLSYIFSLDYFKKFIPVIVNIGNFNFVMLFYSFYNFFILISLLIFIFWYKFISSKNLSKPQFKINSRLAVLSFLVYYSYWFFLGVLIGINLFIYLLLYANLRVFSIIDKDFSFNWISFSKLWISLEENLRYIWVHKFLYVIGLFVSFMYILILYREITLFSKNAIEEINDFYKTDFPYVKIKTVSGEVEGQLKDIKNKNFVTLSKNNELKAVPWNNIQIMEAGNPNGTETIEVISRKSGNSQYKMK